MTGRIYTTKRAAEYCGLSYGHFRNLVSAGEGPVRHKRGRLNAFFEHDLDKWNEDHLTDLKVAS